MYDLLNTQACLSRDLWLPERRLLHYYVQKSDFSGHVVWRAEHSGLSAKPQEAKETQRIAENVQGISGNTQQLTALGSEDQTLGHAQYTPLLCATTSQPISLVCHKVLWAASPTTSFSIPWTNTSTTQQEGMVMWAEEPHLDLSVFPLETQQRKTTDPWAVPA